MDGTFLIPKTETTGTGRMYNSAKWKNGTGSHEFESKIIISGPAVFSLTDSGSVFVKKCLSDVPEN